ncbi:MAG TPA: hypothetical protein VNW47_09925 [Terriglobales bacterium]|jgi:hypothetical protein|nr:hypothetical protein [Terriglobales bacterium]
MTKHFALVFLFACLTVSASAAITADSRKVAEAETIYADLNDAYTVIETIDSGLFPSYRGKDRGAWQQEYTKKRQEFAKLLSKLPATGLSASDAKAVAAMRVRFKSLPGTVSALFSPKGNCQDANNKTSDYSSLRATMVVCFTDIGNNLSFEGGKINRVSGLDLLHQIDEPDRRKAVFMAFVPLWQAINGNDAPDSPYRRMIAMAATDAKEHGSEIDAAAKTAGVDTAEVEHWLEQILDTWRQSTSDQPVEPWDFRYQGGEADRLLGSVIPRGALLPISLRYFNDLGADLKQLGTVFDLDPRPGKAALAYTDWIVAGRMVRGEWQPTIPRVSAPYAHGGLFVLNELIHEEGHVVNFTAMQNRPAYMDWPGGLVGEAFADVPAWSTYEPVWQRKYLGREASEQASLRALYTVVLLDVAWALFELRMLRAPATDPNALWTEITHHYLHIVPHPEFSWWALRVQLADSPGYMINYGFGAILTADMRQHIREQLGPFDAGDPRWYPWLAEHLLRYGSEKDSQTLLRDFLGRPTSPEALLKQIRRLAATP